MAEREQSLFAEDGMPNEALVEEAEAAPKPSWPSKALAWAKEHRTQLTWPAFGLGLVLGWLVLGWWLWPVRWSNTDPWDLRPEHQARYVTLVAEDFWRSSDVRRVQQAVSGWDKAALAKLLSEAQARETNAASRQHLAALAEALKLPDAGKPLLASLLSDKGVVLTVVLSAVPLVVALILALSSLLARTGVSETTEELALEELELAEGAGAALATAVQVAQPPQEQEKSKPAAVLSTSGEGANDEVQDLLTSLFDEDNEGLERLESLSKGLSDVDINDLLRLSKHVVAQMQSGRMPNVRAAAA